MSKKDLMYQSRISKSTMDKMGIDKFVSMEIIDRECKSLNCSVDRIRE